MEDPLFDPWSIDDPPGVAEPEAAPLVPRTGDEQPATSPRWSNTANEQRAPLARMRSRPSPRAEQPRAPQRSSPPRQTVPPAIGPVAPERAALPRGHFVSNLLVPRLESLCARLELAGHSTATDERLTATPPSVRFRLTPRPGGFDDAPESVAAVLEVLFDDAGSYVAGRIWLHPQAESPTSEVRATVSQADLAWLDRLLVDFVEKTLGRP